jgi:uncharacterized membrane protein
VTSKPSTLKKIGDALNTGDDKGIIIAVAISLIIVIGVVVGYYVYHVIYEKPEGYTTIYVLDAQGKAVDYTFNLTLGQNAMFNVYVVNHMGDTKSFQVQEKISTAPISQLPVDAASLSVHTKTLADGEIWPIQAPVTLQNAGSFSIFFELWLDNAGTLTFTGNAVKLTVDVTS